MPLVVCAPTLRRNVVTLPSKEEAVQIVLKDKDNTLLRKLCSVCVLIFIVL
jgi:hypothetical protein